MSSFSRYVRVSGEALSSRTGFLPFLHTLKEVIRRSRIDVVSHAANRWQSTQLHMNLCAAVLTAKVQAQPAKFVGDINHLNGLSHVDAA